MKSVLDCVYVFVFFFFQAEDGIRYLVRSRGLGDVYKRQPQSSEGRAVGAPHGPLILRCGAQALVEPLRWRVPVSYTHLTLPTSDLV